MTARLAPVIALSHGGGPMPLMGDSMHHAITKSLRERVPALLRLGTPQAPRAIVVVTAHWSEDVPTISSGEKHGLLFDYYNFPAQCYEYEYPAAGSSTIAGEVRDVLAGAGFQPKMDGQRGWDHGVFVPMMLINPKADIPIIQLSVLSSENAQQHYQMGLALAQLRNRNIAIIGSGFASFHNLRVMFSNTMESPAFAERNAAWSEAVTKAVTAEESKERGKQLEEWRTWPNAYESHPRGGAEHFMPLIVAAGAGGDQAAKSYSDEFRGIPFYSYYWE